MAQDIVIAGVTYPSVPQINVPMSGGGTAEYMDGTYSEITPTYTSNNIFTQTSWNNTARIRKCGRIGIFCINSNPQNKSSGGSSTYVTLGTIPTGYRPAYTVRCVFPQQTSGQVIVQIDTDGTIKMVKNNTNTNAVTLSLPYIIA